MKRASICISIFTILLCTMCAKPTVVDEKSLFSIEHNNETYEFPNSNSDDMIEARLDNKAETVICFPNDEVTERGTSDSNTITYAAFALKHTLLGDGDYKVVSEEYLEENLDLKLVSIDVTATIEDTDAIYNSTNEHGGTLQFKKSGDYYIISSTKGIVVENMEYMDGDKLSQTVKINMSNIYPLRNVLD